jgi:hypothetical protein
MGDEWDAGAAQKTATQADALYPGAPAARQRTGSPEIARGSGQAPAIPELSLQGLAHAGGAALQRTVDTVMGQLAGVQANGNVKRETVEQLMREGRELQRTANFTDQTQARVWTLRVLAWVANIVSLGIVPGLANLFARGSAFTDSLKRYSLGNGEHGDTEQERLRQIDNLFGQFKTLGEQAKKRAELAQGLGEARKINYDGISRRLTEISSGVDKLTSSDTVGAGYAAARSAISSVFNANGQESLGNAIRDSMVMLEGLVLEAGPSNEIYRKALQIQTALRNLDQVAASGKASASITAYSGGYAATGNMEFREEMRSQAQYVRRLAEELKSMMDGMQEVQNAQDRISGIEAEQAQNERSIAATRAKIVNIIGKLSVKSAEEWTNDEPEDFTQGDESSGGGLSQSEEWGSSEDLSQTDEPGDSPQGDDIFYVDGE